MKLPANLRAAIEKNFRIFMRHCKFLNSFINGKIKVKRNEPSIETGRYLRAAVLHGPCNLKTDFIPEKSIQPMQVLKKQPSFIYYFS